MLGSLCRLALPLTGLTAAELKRLPAALPATLLVLRPSLSRSTIEALAATSWRGFHSPTGGRLVHRLGAKAIVTSEPLDNNPLDPALVIPLPHAQHARPAVERDLLDGLAREFLPKLLWYRLQHRLSAARPNSDVGHSPSQSNTVAMALRGCFADEPALADQLAASLAEAEPNGDEAPQGDPRVLLVEVLWARSHELDRTQLHVAEIAQDLKTAMLATGLTTTLSPRLVGGLLKSVGLRTHRLDRRGRGIRMDGNTRLLIHRLADLYNVPSAAQPFPGCHECAHPEQPEQ